MWGVFSPPLSQTYLRRVLSRGNPLTRRNPRSRLAWGRRRGKGKLVSWIRNRDSGRSGGTYHQSSSGSCSMVVDHQRHFDWATQPRDRHRRRRRFGPNTRLGGAVRHELAFTTTTARGDSSPAASNPARGHDGGGDV